VLRRVIYFHLQAEVYSKTGSNNIIIAIIQMSNVVPLNEYCSEF